MTTNAVCLHITVCFAPLVVTSGGKEKIFSYLDKQLFFQKEFFFSVKHEKLIIIKEKSYQDILMILLLHSN